MNNSNIRVSIGEHHGPGFTKIKDSPSLVSSLAAEIFNRVDLSIHKTVLDELRIELNKIRKTEYSQKATELELLNADL